MMHETLVNAVVENKVGSAETPVGKQSIYNCRNGERIVHDPERVHICLKLVFQQFGTHVLRKTRAEQHYPCGMINPES